MNNAAAAIRTLPNDPRSLGKCNALNPHKSNCPAKSPHCLVQIAVSTMLRLGRIGGRGLLRIEHCRYGTLEIWHQTRAFVKAH
jgi:hypothetical protein